MKKTNILLVGFGLLTALLCLNTGCENIRDFEAENPIAYDILASTAKAVLLAQVPRITDDPFYLTSLNSVVDVAFQLAKAPGDVAAELADGVAKVYPNEPELQSMIVQEFADALRAPVDSSTPASAPHSTSSGQAGAIAYQRAIADALAPPIALNGAFEPASVYAALQI
jgi:hypothetical protein